MIQEQMSPHVIICSQVKETQDTRYDPPYTKSYLIKCKSKETRNKNQPKDKYNRINRGNGRDRRAKEGWHENKCKEIQKL